MEQNYRIYEAVQKSKRGSVTPKVLLSGAFILAVLMVPPVVGFLNLCLI